MICGLTLFIIWSINQIMSWWVMITTNGRLLQNLLVDFYQDEMRVTGARFEEGEGPAILMDQFHKKARIYVPLEECQRLAALHQYELFYRQGEDDREELVAHIHRVLAFLHAKENEPPKLSVLKRLFKEIAP